MCEFDEVITRYDLTNPYFEGTGKGNANAALGRSKEKRSGCPLVILVLVLDGNASEPKTLAKMIAKLAPHKRKQPPTVVLDAGIATEENIAWRVDNDYRYVVVSRKRQRQFDAAIKFPTNRPYLRPCRQTQSQLIKETDNNTIRIQRVVCADGEALELYCHSAQREKKDKGIHPLFAQRFEGVLEKLASGLHKKCTVKQYDKIVERIGRLKQKYSRAAQYDDITVEQRQCAPALSPYPTSV